MQRSFTRIETVSALIQTSVGLISSENIHQVPVYLIESTIIQTSKAEHFLFSMRDVRCKNGCKALANGASFELTIILIRFFT